MTLTLTQYNEALTYQRQMTDSGKHADFGTVFASALRGDPTAFEIFEAWVHIHPDLSAALDFLRNVRPGPLAVALCGVR